MPICCRLEGDALLMGPRALVTPQICSRLWPGDVLFFIKLPPLVREKLTSGPLGLPLSISLSLVLSLHFRSLAHSLSVLVPSPLYLCIFPLSIFLCLALSFRVPLCISLGLSVSLFLSLSFLSFSLSSLFVSDCGSSRTCLCSR